MVFTLKMDCDDRGGFIGVDEYGEPLLNGKSSQDRFQMAASSRKSLSVDSGYSKVGVPQTSLSQGMPQPVITLTGQETERHLVAQRLF